MTEDVKTELKRILDKYAQVTEEERVELLTDYEASISGLSHSAQMDFVRSLEQTLQDKLDEQQKLQKRNEFVFFWLELFAWPVLGLLTSFIFWGLDFIENVSRFIYIALFFLLPIIFRSIFLKLPLAYFQERYSLKKEKENEDFISRLLYSSCFPIKTHFLLSHYIKESKSHAERLFSHSRACLFWGCFIAVLGLGIFFFLNDSISIKGLNDPHLENNLLNILIIKILEYLPRFGVLFFIEYIAFFFLKQYRILMEEYRYYESIKREKQDILATYLSIKELEDKKESLDQFLNYMDKHSARVPLITGTHKLKTEKMVYEDLDLLEKIIPLVQAFKSNEKAKGD